MEKDDCCCCNIKEENKGKWRITQLIAGAVFFAVGIIVDNFFPHLLSAYLPLVVFIAAYLILGGNIVLRAVKKIFRGEFFDENFLMSVATIGAFIIGEYPEAVAVMLFYQIGEFFQDSAVVKSKKSISDLMDIRPDFANLKKTVRLLKLLPTA